MSERLKQHSLALVGYLIIAIIISYPLILNFTTSILGPREDNLGWIWYMWWVKYCLAEGGRSLYSTNYIFYPNGIDLSMNSYTYFKTILAIPLQYMMDVVTTYNVLGLFSYVMSGFGVYLLVRQLVGGAGVAFVCGLIYALAPTHVWHLDHHLDVGAIEMIPFFLCFLVRFYQDRETKDLIISGVFFVLTSLSCWYYMMYLIYFMVIFSCYFLYTQRVEALGLIKKTTVMVAGSFIVVFPFLYPLISFKLSGVKLEETPSSFNCVADLAAPFILSAKHPLADWFKVNGFYNKLPCFPWETNVFVGYSVLALAVIGYIKVKNKWTRFAAFFGVVFWLLSLGKQLQWRGQIILESIYLPYFWFAEQIPLVNTMRTPARFMVMVMLALAVLYGYGLDFLMKYLEERRNLPARTARFGVLLLAGALIFLEFMPYPNKLLNVEEATQAKYLARNLPDEGGEEYAILELPIMANYIYNQTLMYRQTRHRKKLLDGFASRIPVGVYDFLNQSPLRILRNTPGKADLNYFKLLKPFLTQNKIKYIVLNRYMVPDPKYTDFIEKSLRQIFLSHGELNPKVGLYRVY